MDRSFTTPNCALLKRTKMNETDIEEDRISKLPDSLIVVQILSRLPDTKYAIRTSVLSKRWQYLWQSVPCLLFDDFSFIKSATRALGDFDIYDLPFIEFFIAVDNALAKFQLGNLNKFELYANYDNRFDSYVKNWIEFAFTRNVKQFKIYLRFVDYDQQCAIESESFYVNSHFTHIDVGFCILHPTVRVRWDNVTNLSISNSKLDEDLIANILSGSPLLKTLTFQSCHGSYINICSDSVKDLVLVGYEAEEHGNVVEINAPNILSFRIIGELWISSIILVDVSSLVKAELNYKVPRYYSRVRKRDEEELLNGLMFKLQHVKEIKFGACCFKTLSRLEAKGLYFPSKLVGVDVSSIYDLYSDVEGATIEVESGDSE